MPIEVELLRKFPVVLPSCPECETAPFVPFMRGEVHRSPWSRPLSWAWSTLRFKPWPYCAVICSDCKHVVAWEWVDVNLFQKAYPQEACDICGDLAETHEAGQCIYCDRVACGTCWLDAGQRGPVCVECYQEGEADDY